MILRHYDDCPQGSIEEFIVNHKATLKKLEIKRCLMLYETGGGSRLWSEMWERLNAELVELVDLVVLADSTDDTVPLKYSSRTISDTPHYFQSSRIEKDMAALERFNETVAARKSRLSL